MKRIISLRILCLLALFSMFTGTIHAKPMPTGKDGRSLVNAFFIISGAVFSLGATALGAAGYGLLKSQAVISNETCKELVGDIGTAALIMSVIVGVPGVAILLGGVTSEIINQYNE